MTRIMSLAIFLLLSLSPIFAQKFDTPEGASPIVIRVGAIYYDDSAEQYQRIRSILSSFENSDRTANKSKRAITFKLVVGTYDEVYHWYRSDQIDLAVMNPGPLALLLKEFGREEMTKAFVGTRGIIPGQTSIAAEGGMVPRDKYNSIMVLNREAIRSHFPSLFGKQTLTDAEAKQITDLVLDRARQRQTHFLFVHPFSTSGYIFPRKFLKEKTGVDLTASDYELTYSHNVSLTEIRDSGVDQYGRLKVAFVSDETETTKDDKQLLTIRSGDLDTKIVQDALVFTPDFVRRESAELERVKQLLRSSAGQQTFNLTTAPDWWNAYEEIGRWIDTFDGAKTLLSNELTLDQIIRRINNYNLHHREKPARVALVLSGGGAKCAYQLGAVEVIEDKLKQAQLENGAARPGIDLVVGTSGGAINALTIAAEVTKED
ncbi:MAG TPA: patatin-like phospholipase family protein, partial [Pyrinomonadaceae bacterium]|nr:patatin-like phospholipase family protein [Pyrinomonadaceae bacterium]